MVADNSPDRFLHEGAATQSDDGRLVFERLKKFAELLLLQLAISRLALLGKQRRNCATSAAFNQGVESKKDQFNMRDNSLPTVVLPAPMNPTSTTSSDSVVISGSAHVG